MIANRPVRRVGVIAPLQVHRIATDPPVNEGDRDEHQTVDDSQKNLGVHASQHGRKTEPHLRQHGRRPPEEETDEKKRERGPREGPGTEDQSADNAGGGENGKGFERSGALGIILLTYHGSWLRSAQKMV